MTSAALPAEPGETVSWRSLVRDIADYPQAGVTFRDITPLLGDGPAFRQVVDELAERFRDVEVDRVVGVEARGFILAAPIAYRLGAGFVPVRKPGKLPYRTTSVTYELEYGSDTLEVHVDAVAPGDRVLVVDDVLATGGTAAAAATLVTSAGGHVAAVAFLMELTFLDGRSRMGDHDVRALLSF